MELISVDRPYNGAKAKLGDVVYARRDRDEDPAPPQEVVYVGMEAFVVESSGGTLTIYRKDTAGMHIFSTEKVCMVNGFEVPAPLEADPGEGRTIYVADPTLPAWCFEVPQSSTANKALLIVRGLAHATAAAAITHAKAMIGIDPYARKCLDDAWGERPAPPAGEGLPEPGSDAAPPTPPEASSL